MGVSQALPHLQPGPQRHCFGVKSKAGGMEKLLFLALSLVQVCRATLPADNCIMSMSVWAVQVHLTTVRISPNMGQLCKHLLGKKERPKAAWRGLARPFFISGFSLVIFLVVAPKSALGQMVPADLDAYQKGLSRCHRIS